MDSSSESSDCATRYHTRSKAQRKKLLNRKTIDEVHPKSGKRALQKTDITSITKSKADTPATPGTRRKLPSNATNSSRVWPSKRSKEVHSNFIVWPTGERVLAASEHQADLAQRSLRFRNQASQCVAMSTSFLAYSFIGDPSEWTQLTMDLVLFTGQELYELCRRVDVPSVPSSGYLRIENLPSHFEIFGKMLRIMPTVDTSLFGTAFAPLVEGWDVLTLAGAIEALFNSNANGVLIYRGQALGLQASNGNYFFFDSHAVLQRDTGLHKSCVVQFTTVSDLISFVYRHLRISSTNNEEFSIHEVKFELVAPAQQEVIDLVSSEDTQEDENEDSQIPDAIRKKGNRRLKTRKSRHHRDVPIIPAQSLQVRETAMEVDEVCSLLHDISFDSSSNAPVINTPNSMDHSDTCRCETCVQWETIARKLDDEEEGACIVSSLSQEDLRAFFSEGLDAEVRTGPANCEDPAECTQDTDPSAEKNMQSLEPPDLTTLEESDDDCEVLWSAGTMEVTTYVVPDQTSSASKPPGTKLNMLKWDNNKYVEKTVRPAKTGGFNIICTNCFSRNLLHEKVAKSFSICCANGNVPVPLVSFDNYPPLFKNLLTNQHEHSKPFLDNITALNSVLAFVSISYQEVGDREAFSRYAGSAMGSILRVRGQFQQTGFLAPSSREKPKFGQNYYVSPSEGFKSICNFKTVKNVPISLKQELYNYIRNNNLYAKAYTSLAEEVNRQEIRDGRVDAIGVAFKRYKPTHLERNNPALSNSAVLFTSNEGKPDDTEFVLRLRSQTEDHPFLPIHRLSPYGEPMCFPLFYPNGGYGWTTAITAAKRTSLQKRNISMTEYFSARLVQRTTEDDCDVDVFNPILHGRKLLSHYFLQAWMKAEQQALNWFKFNQDKLRVESRDGLLFYLEKLAQQHCVPVARPVILPANYPGSRRFYIQKTQDLLALCGAVGKPDLFITFTCNPFWDEIVQEMNKDNPKKDVEPADRPDVVVRVFHAKLKFFLTNDLAKQNVFGEVAGFAYVIEFTPTTGLPHAHIFVILKKECKPDSPEKIDQIVTAEFPDPKDEPRLYQLVSSRMVHICELANCLDQDGKCMKKFPRLQQQHTALLPDGSVIYRRRNFVEEHDVQVGAKKYRVNNSVVVPYNKHASLRYDCHINVEVCNTIKAVKYMTKYATKTYRAGSVTVVTDKQIEHDEVKFHVQGRVISVFEAAWRIYRFSLGKSSHSVILLPVHLEGQQEVIYEEGQEQGAFVRASKDTKLTAWFKLNVQDPSARKLLYSDIPIHYKYVESARRWEDRSKKDIHKIVARMWDVHPSAGERFYLRLLLLHVRGCTSYQDIRTVTPSGKPTKYFELYKDACEYLGLLQSDRVWDDCLKEAAERTMAPQMRQLFAVILAQCNPTDPRKLWDTYVEYLIDDYLHNGIARDDAQVAALRDIRDSLTCFGKRYNSYMLPAIPFQPPPVEDHSEDTVIDYRRELNTEQKTVFDTIVNTCLTEPFQRRQRLFFLDAPGGTGKTFTLNKITGRLQQAGKKVLNFATTGIASDLLMNGRTAHWGFGLPSNICSPCSSKLKAYDIRSVNLREADLICIDECSSLSTYALHAINQLMKLLCTTPKAFGDKVLLLVGDFRQTLPVIPGGNNCDILDACISRSSLFPLFQVLRLTTNMRAHFHPEFCKFLIDVGNGFCNGIYSDNPEGYSLVLPAIHTVRSPQQLLTLIYGDAIMNCDIGRLTSSILVTPRNKHAEYLNILAMNKIERNYKTYLSLDWQDPEEKIRAPLEHINSLRAQGTPPHKLQLKVHSIAMIIRNMDLHYGLLNGTRILITSLQNNIIIGKILTGSKKDSVVMIPRIVFKCFEEGYTFYRRQFPIIPAFALTINKSQGQSFNNVGVYLPTPVFSHGQLYVALSRATSPQNLKVCVEQTSRQYVQDDGCIKTVNIVWQEVL